MKPFVYLALFLFFVSSCAQSKTKAITELSQNDIINGTLVDVRTPKEFAEGHIDQALNINWFDSDFVGQMETIDRDETIYVYCKKGGRSAKAAHLLDSLGYKNVIDLEGGYDAWAKKD